jgi:deoxyribodipyrimidine photo-lyase
LKRRTANGERRTAPLPPLRVRQLNQKPIDPEGDFVLYWMTAFRRTKYNFALERAVEHARNQARPLVILEALRVGYRWASDRFHHFAIQGMADNQKRLASKPVLYYPYLELKADEGKGFLAALAQRASVVVGDDFPSFFLPRMMQAAAYQVPVAFELVDSNGILPLRAADKVYVRAVDFRRFLQKTLEPHMDDFPQSDPLSRIRLPILPKLPAAITQRWPAADVATLAGNPGLLHTFPIDHAVGITEKHGGERAAQRTLRRFLESRLSRYADHRNQPEEEATSGLSPYFHWGHIGAHQVFEELMDWDGWTDDRMAAKATGSRSGWWGASKNVEAFLDEFLTWRELGYNMTWQRDDYATYESLPNWAQETIELHSEDSREHVYSRERLESSETHDELWNAAQRQLVQDGVIHNYLRMLWGKKIYEWSPNAKQALRVMIELNNKYGLDGRNPNSYSGIFWVLGRYDRAWGPERPVFGKLRYMSSENTARKVRVREYMEKHGGGS